MIELQTSKLGKEKQVEITIKQRTLHKEWREIQVFTSNNARKGDRSIGRRQISKLNDLRKLFGYISKQFFRTFNFFIRDN